MLLDSKQWTDDEGRHTFKVNAELSLHAGNARAYFSITADHFINTRFESAGCLHDDIKRLFEGRYDDLIALHLSDDDGAPMHAEENGWYWLAGCAGGLGQQYHGANQKYLSRTPLKVFCDHCRIGKDEAEQIIRTVVAELGPECEQGPAHTKADYARARAKWRAICDAMRPRWQREATAAIEKYRLPVVRS